MGNPGTRYSAEFKAEAVSQVINRGYTVREVATGIGVSEYSLDRWVHRARKAGEVSADGMAVAELANGKAPGVLRMNYEKQSNAATKSFMKPTSSFSNAPPRQPTAVRRRAHRHPPRRAGLFMRLLP
jgi:transposase